MASSPRLGFRWLTTLFLTLTITAALAHGALAASPDTRRNETRKGAATALIQALATWVKENRCYPLILSDSIRCQDLDSSGEPKGLGIDGGSAFEKVLPFTTRDPSTGLELTQVNVDPKSQPEKPIPTSGFAVGAGRKCNKAATWIVPSSSLSNVAVLYRLEPLTPVKYGCVAGTLGDVAAPGSAKPGTATKGL